MHYTLLITATALVATTLAAPTVGTSSMGISVLQVDTGKKILKNGPAQIVKTYQKFGKSPPAAAVQGTRVLAAQVGSVSAIPEDMYDSAYLVPVTIGGTNFNLDFDTGSSDLWVFSSLQQASQTTGHDIYQVSSTKRWGTETWSISYGDGSSASGNVYHDTVNIGGLSITQQAIEAAKTVSWAFTEDPSDGLVGLAFPIINTCTPTQCGSPLTKLVSQGDISQPLFTSDLKYHAAGTYDFGYINATKYSGSIAYMNVNTAHGFWEFSATAFQIGNKTITTTAATADSIADTGTTLLYLPSNVVTAYYAQVQGSSNSASQGGYIFPCSASLPAISIQIGGAYHTVPGQYMNFAPVNDGRNSCFGGIQSNSGFGFSILSDVFLKSQFVVWNYGSTPRIGFAAQS